jgi:proteasome accessory factor B
MALFLASRLALRQTDENNPHMQQALLKVSDVLPSPVAERLKSGIESIAGKKLYPEFLKIFEAVAVAWITQRQLKIEYLSLNSEDIREWVVNPYFVEMTGIGYSMYVIGYAVREGKEGVITFKIDRIQTAELLDTTFEMPQEPDIESLLASSWGVMWGDDSQIKLRFSSRVTRRVKESIWHHSQSIEDLPEGGCILKIKVGSMLEITPWIRSWGPDVEVLEPLSLREEFKKWAEQLFGMYHPHPEQGE